MAETVCIVNPNAGGGRSASAWPAIASRLTAAGVEFDTRFTTAPGDATHQARKAITEGATTVIAVGGDGTLHEVVNGFFADTIPLNPRARLGILPSGTGSDLIKTLGIPKDTAGAVTLIARGEARPIDLGRATFTNHAGTLETRWFINTASAGLSGDTMQRMTRLPSFLTGSLRYNAAAVWSIVAYSPPEIVVAVDDEPAEPARVLLLVVANGRYFGAGMHIAPEASINDGEFDFVAIQARPFFEVLRNFPRIFAGTHLALPSVDSGRGKRVAIMSQTPMLLELDGEQPGSTPATFEVIPGALQVIQPLRA